MTAGRATIALMIATALAVAPLAAHAATLPAPKVSIRKNKQLPTPLPLPFDEAASTDRVNADVSAAFARAKAGDKRVLLDFGGNWCGWCRILDGVMGLPEVKPFVQAHYEVVHVYASSKPGATDRNLAVLKRFGLTSIDGYPWVIVADADGKVLTSSYEITDDNHQTPQTMVNWIAKWAA